MSDENNEKWYVWYHTEAPSGRPVRHEFPMPISRQDARNRIAHWLGVKELPEEDLVSHDEREKLKKKASAEKDAA